MIELYGWSDFVGRALEPFAARGLAAARVIVQQRGRYLLASPEGEIAGHVSGRLLHRAEEGELPVTGDWVAVRTGGEGGEAVIEAVLPRRTAFVRKSAGKAQKPQLVAANVDVALLVLGLDGDFNLRRLERYLALAWQSGARPLVVLTKADLSDDPAGATASAKGIAAGCVVLSLSALTGAGLEALSAHLHPGETCVLLGSSGAGKSTLANALIGHAAMATAAVSDRDGRGRHTTTQRQLLRLPNGALLLDTPGMRELGLIDAEDGVDLVFGDLDALQRQCRFRNCSHREEPGCAISAALENGTLDAGRWANFRKLERELAHLDRKEDRLASAKERKRWAAVSKAQRALYKNRDRGD